MSPAIDFIKPQLVSPRFTGRALPLENLKDLVALDEFFTLQDGWLNGEGKAFDQVELQWFSKTLKSNYDTQLTLPRFYPTAEGGIQAEWACENVEISLEVDLTTKKAEYQSLDVINNISDEITFDLSHEEGWKKLNETLRQYKALVLKQQQSQPFKSC